MVPFKCLISNDVFLEKVATPTKLENIAESLKVFEVMNHFDEDECERFLKEFNQFSKTKKSIDSCHQFWKRIPPMFVSKLFLLTTIKKNEYKQLMPSGSVATNLSFQSNPGCRSNLGFQANPGCRSKQDWLCFVVTLLSQGVSTGSL